MKQSCQHSSSIIHRFDKREVWMWRQPTNLSESDEAMMAEILDLLVADSPNAGQQATTLTTASSTVGSNNDSSNFFFFLNLTDTNFNASTNQDCEAACPGNEGCARGRDLPNEFISLTNEELNIEERHLGQTGRQEGEKALGARQQTQNAMPNILTSLAQAAPTRQQLYVTQPSVIQPLPPQLPMYLPEQQYFAADPDLLVSAGTMNPSSVVSPAPMNQFQAARAHQIPPVQSAFTQSRPSLPKVKKGGFVSKVLPKGHQLHVLNLAETDDLRRKLRMQTASRRYRKRKKDESKQKKSQIQQLQAELARLQQLEAQSKQYQQRSEQSLNEELKMHKAEVADLSSNLREAAKEELHWINLMKAHLNK